MVGRIIIILLVAALIVVAVEYLPLTHDDTPAGMSSLVDISENARPSVISIWTERDGEPQNQGSGFIISNDAYVVTNYHVVKDANSYTAEFDINTGIEPQPLELVQYNEEYDLALMRITGEGEWRPMGLTRTVKQGAPVIAFGYPEDVTEDDSIQMTATSGIVSRISNDEAGNTLIIQTDAFLTYGSSGGPLVNAITGGVVGICTWAYHDENDATVPGINYALSVNKVYDLFGGYLDMK